MKTTDELIKQLKTRDSSVKEHVIGKLTAIGDEQAVDALIQLIKDKNRFIRQEVTTALGRIGGAKITEALNQALTEEKDVFVQDSIKRALAKL